MLIALVFIACVIAAMYGIAHDQLTYTISPEYYTKFKFYQFGFMDIGSEAIFPNPRIEVSLVGLLATWWTGIPIGIILGLVAALIYSNRRQMFAITLKAFIVVISITFLTGLIGLGYGHFYLANKARSAFVDWYIPDNLVDFQSFVKVGSMHNFSYIGGMVGLFGALIFIFTQRGRLKNTQV